MKELITKVIDMIVVINETVITTEEVDFRVQQNIETMYM